jgi:predicted ribosome quality control (RQC) complex YloA/Tae2 family protein
MKTQISSFDIFRLVRDFQVLEGAFLDKAYQLSQDELVIRFNIPKVKKIELYINFKGHIYLTDRSKPKPDQPSTFAMVLRKHLNNARVTEITQYEFDRIIVIRLSKQQEFRLILEIFGEGNVILVQDDEPENKIINTLFQRSWSQRTLRPNHPYKFPPVKVNPAKITLNEIQDIFQTTKRDLVRSLAMDLNLGGLYSEEVCFQLKLDKNQKPGQLEKNQVESLYQVIAKLFDQTEKHPEPRIIYSNSDPIDVVPINLMLYESNKSETFQNLSEGLEEYFSRELQAPEEQLSDRAKSVLGEQARLERQMTQQKEAIDKFKGFSLEKKALADLIYQHYKLCESILEQIQILRKQYDWDEIIDDELLKFDEVEELNPHEGYVKVKLPGAALHGDVAKDDTGVKPAVLKLDIRLNVNKNAERYYEASKQAKEKLEGAKTACLATEGSLKRIKMKLEKSLAQDSIDYAESQKISAQTRKTFWFEKYRWFYSSDGMIVVAGSDASSNEKVVKKYLKAGGRYAHADMHGAPSVVIRKPDSGENIQIPENTLNEACIFAVIHSKAWNAGIGGGNAYWVNADQVSRTPAAGEFLPKGAFMVRGKRNFVSGIELKAAIGKIEYEGNEILMCGPIPAVKERATQYVVFIPGKRKKTDIAKKLSSIFNYSVDEIMKILPPGDLDLLESVGLELKL